MKVPVRLRGDVTEETLDAIAASVDRAESETSAEIVVHIVHRLLPLERARSRAIRAFRRLGVDKTTRRNGVLLFVVMTRRQFEIVADSGIDEKVKPEAWRDVAGRMGEEIASAGFEKGICRGIERIGSLLKEHFPREPGDVNELPDRPAVSPDPQ